MPEISIVLPTYNGEKFIKKSIDSILDQTYQDWELIIVNDCSSDHTLQIAREYEARDKRIRVISNPINKKLPESLNIGFREAKGRYLTWTSDDNLYLPEALKEMHDYLESHRDSIMVCASICFIDENDQKTGLTMSYDPHFIYVSDSVGACFMYRHEVISEVGVYDTSMFCVEDYDYWLRILKHYGKIDYINRVLYLYRDQKESLTATKSDTVRKQRFKLRKKYFDFLIDSLKNHNDSILPLLTGMLSDGDVEFDAVKNQLLSYSKEILPIVKIPEEGNLIIYGAGNIGRAAIKKYGSRIKYFADGNPLKAGTYLEGVKIIPSEGLNQYLKENHLVIAVGAEKMPEVMKIFKDRRINEYSVFAG